VGTKVSLDKFTFRKGVQEKKKEKDSIKWGSGKKNGENNIGVV